MTRSYSEGRDHTMIVRLTMTEAERFKRAAAAEQLSRSEWVRQVLAEAAAKLEKKKRGRT